MASARLAPRSAAATRMTSVKWPVSGSLTRAKTTVSRSIDISASSSVSTMRVGSPPAQRAGSAIVLTRSLRQPRSCVTSSSSRGSRSAARSDTRRRRLAPDVVHARLELDHVVDERSPCGCPVHAADNAAPLVAIRRPEVGELREDLQHPTLIDLPVAKVRVRVAPQLEVPSRLSSGRVDADASESVHVIVTLVRIDDVNRPVAAREAVSDERQQDTILLVVVAEEGADVTGVAESGTG